MLSIRRLTLIGVAAVDVLLALPAAAPAQTIYVTNSENRTVMRFTPEGKETKFADASPGIPAGLAADGRGNLYVGVTGDLKGTVRKYTANGKFTVFAAGFGQVQDLAFHDGNLYVAVAAQRDDETDKILKIGPDGKVSTFVTKGLEGPGGLAFDKEGNLYVSNGNDTKGFIMKYTPEGKGSVFVSKGLKLPAGLAFDSKGNLFVSNDGDGSIHRFDPSGKGKVYIEAQNQPAGLCVDAQDNLYKVDFKDNNLMKFSPPDGSGIPISQDLHAPTSVLVVP